MATTPAPLVPVVPATQLAASQARLQRVNEALAIAQRQSDPGGIEGTLLAAAGGALDGILSEMVIGNVMGQDITLAPAAPLLDIGIHMATGGQLPGGIAGSVCRVIRAASHSQTSHLSRSATKAAITFARSALTAPRPTDRSSAPHPTA